MNATSRAAALLSQMSLDDKLELMTGVDNMYTRALPGLHLRRIRMADASMGLRDDETEATAFPAFIALAETWNQ